MTLAEASFDAFDEKKLRSISHLEQDMATGIDEDGKKTTKKELQSRLVDMVRDKNIGYFEKLRLLIIYIISQDGIDAATRKQLFSVANFKEEDEEAVQNLVNLGVTLQSVSLYAILTFRFKLFYRALKRLLPRSSILTALRRLKIRLGLFHWN